jgi:hypothetical protein
MDGRYIENINTIHGFAGESTHQMNDRLLMLV